MLLLAAYNSQKCGFVSRDLSDVTLFTVCCPPQSAEVNAILPANYQDKNRIKGKFNLLQKTPQKTLYLTLW